MSHTTAQRWDIFCRIVDNFGDIGVCWRLSQQLAHEHQLQIRLFIDDFAAATKIIAQLDLSKQSQTISSIEICTWPANHISPAPVVIETFACGLPKAYLLQMQASKSFWVNLEYLSAENWVGDFHAKPSPHPTLALTKHYFFPGFTEETGGLIREAHISQNTVCHSDESRDPVTVTRLDSAFCWNDYTKNVLKISLFGYPNAPIEDLLTALQAPCLQANNHAVLVYVPASSILPKIAQFFGKNSLDVGETITRGNLTLQVLPFLSQVDYDQLLRSCDLNFVRGEDSWIRAIWAAKPFIWQPYFQTENTHIIKLNAFLDVYYEDCEPQCQQAIRALHAAWQTNAIPSQTWQQYLAHWPAIHTYTAAQSRQLATQTDLASKLVIFLQKLSVKV